MNKLIIKEVIEHDLTPTLFPTYRKETSIQTYYCITPECIIKVYQSGYNGYCSIMSGSYSILGSDCVSKDTIECTADEFYTALNKAEEYIQSCLQNTRILITHEGDE